MVPAPVLLNLWKHHAGWVRERIAEAVRAGPDGVAELPRELVVVGTRLMDLYTGPLTPADVAVGLLDQLRAAGRLEPGPFADWLAGQGGYAVLDLADGSRWAVRLGPLDGRYVHVHPGRYSPHTVRVRADTLRTAVMARAVGGLSGRSADDVGVVNEARARHLGLPPVAEVSAALAAVTGLL